MFYLQLCGLLLWPEAGYGQAQVEMEDGTEKPTDVASCQLPQWHSSIPAREQSLCTLALYSRNESFARSYSSQGSTQYPLLWVQAEAKPRNLLPF